MSGSTKPRSVHSSSSGRIVTENPALLQLLRERTGESSIGTTTRPAAGGTRCVITDSRRLDNTSQFNPAYTNPVSTQASSPISGQTSSGRDPQPTDSYRIANYDSENKLQVIHSDSDKDNFETKNIVSDRVNDKLPGKSSATRAGDLNISQIEKDSRAQVIPGLNLQKNKEKTSDSLLSRVDSSLLNDDYSQELVTPARVRSSVIVTPSLHDKRLHDVDVHVSSNVNPSPASVQTHRLEGVKGTETSHAVEVTSGAGYSVRSDTKTNLFNYISPHSPDHRVTAGGHSPVTTQRSEGQGQPTATQSEIVKDSLEASQNLQDSLDFEQSQQLKDSLDSDSGKNSPITGRKTYPVESPTSNKVPKISSASAHSRKDNPNALSQIRPDSELSRGIPTPKPSSGVPESAKNRVPQPTARSEEPTARRSTSSVYAVANPAILAAQGDTPREGTQNSKFTPRAEQAVQRREPTQGSAKPQSIIKRDNTQGSVKPQSETKREHTKDSVKPAKRRGREDIQDSVRAPSSGRNSSKSQRGHSVNNNTKVNSATSGRKSGRSVVSFHPEPKNKSDDSDSDEEQIRAQSNHLKERVPTPHPRSPLKPDQVTPRRDTTPQIKEWDSDGQSDNETPKPQPSIPQPQGKSPSPVVQERRSANAANTTLPTVKRVYVDSPTFTPEEEDQYRFVESRLDDGQDDIEDTFRKIDKGDKPMATTTQAPPVQGSHPGYARDNYDGGAYNSQYSQPPPEPQYRENYQPFVRKENGGQGAPQGGQYIRKDSDGPRVQVSDQYGRNNNQGQRPQGYDSQYGQQAQNRGYPQDVRGGRDNQGDPRGQARDLRQDNRYEDRNRVMSQNKDQGQNDRDRYEDRNTGYNRYEDRNEQPQYDDRNQYDRYEDRNQYNSYNRGDRGQEDRNDPPQYQGQGPGRYETNDRNRYDNRNEADQYDDRNDNYRQPRSLVQNGYEPEEDEQQLIKQEEEYQAHLQRRLRTQAQQDEEFVIPKLPLEDALEDPWQNPPPPPHQGYQEPSGYDERETERMEIVNPPPIKYDFVENNKVDYGKIPDKSYAFLLERRKEGESKLETVFVTPKGRSRKTQSNVVTANKSRGDSPPEEYIPSENASMAEALWAKRSTALEKRKDAKQTGKSKTASGTSLRKNRGLQKYPSENGLIRQPLYSQGQSQGRQPVHMYGTPTRNHYLEPLENKSNKPKPNDRGTDGRGMPPASFKPIDLKPVTQEIVTDDGQRISVDINLKVLSPRGEGGDPRGIPQVSAEVLHGSQATGGVRPVGAQYYPGAYEGQQDVSQDPYRQQYYQPAPGPPPGPPPGLPPPEQYNFDYSQAPDQENQLPPQTNQDYEPQYQPQGSGYQPQGSQYQPQGSQYQPQGSPPYQSPPHQSPLHRTQPPQQTQPPEVPAPQNQNPQYQRHPSYDQQSHPVYDQQQHPSFTQQPSYEAEPKHQSPNPYPKIPPISAGTEDRFASGPIRVELQGYTAIHQKARMKDPNEQPWYQVYTLSDYKKLKKELEAGRGPLGPDLESETFKEKLEKRHKQNEYARLVMERNRQELLDRKPVQRRQPSQEQRDENKRRTALDYAKNVPKPVVKAKPSQYNSYEVSSQLSPLSKKGNQSPVKTQTPIDVVDLQKLQKRHEEDKQNVAMIKQNIPQKV